ncbi:hypothetical protein GCM10011581_30590 [Saccharopolyspora subtropica]|uniref:Archease domain-containing protein n=1 Tax=Saccharopolyspora thermophila TaxID=89367 RepID=A0A917K0M4_9PSEU|nr:archease [Saccharopolyspora subtropica]GGI91385.1 hypothetical protein GCM10011581_30590 [Saccharopolyspora subtropica]
MTSGFRFLPHTADIRFEAWGGTREECLAAALRALVAGFAGTPARGPGRARSTEFDGTDEELLLAVLDEVIYRLDTEGAVPVEISVRPTGTGVALEMTETTVDDVDITGATPKAVSLHELWIGRDERGWRCTVTIDV